MKKHGQITAFYFETLVLIVVFVAVILVLTQVFGAARVKSGEAKDLTNAVSLAQNAAEAVASADEPEDVLALLDEGGSARMLEGAPVTTVRACYDDDRRPDANGQTTVDVTWEPDGDLVSSRITVSREGLAAPVYELDTAVYVKEAGA